MQYAQTTLCLMLALFLASAALAQEKEAPPPALRIPDLPGADMRMSWNDFKSLLALIEREEPKVQKECPVPFSILSADYTAEALSGTVRIQAVLEIHVWSESWVSIPILGKDVGLESAKVDGEPSLLTQTGERYAVMLGATGTHTVQLVFYVPVETTEGVVSFSFPCAQAAMHQMSLRLPLAEAQIFSPQAASLEAKNEDGAIVARMVFRSTDQVTVQWRLPAVAVAEPPKEAPRVTCAIDTLVTAGESHLNCQSTLQFDVLRGEINRFLLRLPSSAQILKLEGTGSEWTAVPENDMQNVEVRLNHTVKDHYVLTARYESPIPTGAANLATPVLHAAEVARETGRLAVATEGNVEVNAAPEIEGLQRIDLSELSAELRALSFQPILHAFRYQNPEYQLVLEYRRLEDVPIRPAAIEQAALTSVLTSEGYLVTQVSYSVRNHFEKFLRMRLPAEAEVWGAKVTGKLVHPAAGNTPSGEKPGLKEILIPLPKSANPEQTDAPFQVEVAYMTRLFETAPLGYFQQIRLDAPETNLLANRFAWEVLLPEDRALYASEGDIKPAIGRLALLGIPVEPGGKGKQETLRRMREGIERFLVTDINNPAAAAMTGSKPRYDGSQPKVQSPAGSAYSGPMVAGVLPVSFNFPRTGTPYGFQRTLVPADMPLKLTLELCDRHIPQLAMMACNAVPFLWSLATVLIFLRRPVRERIVVQALAALVVALLPPALVAYSLPGFFSGLSYWALAGIALAALFQAWRGRFSGIAGATHAGSGAIAAEAQ